MDEPVGQLLHLAFRQDEAEVVLPIAAEGQRAQLETKLKSAMILTPLKKLVLKDCSALETLTLCAGINKLDVNGTSLKVINVPAKKTDYYKKRLPEELHKLIVELPAEKKAKK